MNKDDTVIMPLIHGNEELQVGYQEESTAKIITRIITKTTILGRLDNCNIQFIESGVSRQHAELFPTRNGWSIRDLDSANGTLLNGKLIKDAAIVLGQNEIQLGCTGPKLWVEPITKIQETKISTAEIDKTQFFRKDSPNYKTGNNQVEQQDSKPLTSKQIRQHYFGDQENDAMGDRTRLLRKIIRLEHTKQSHRYRIIISIFSLLLLIISGLAIYQQKKLQDTQKMAVDIFYDMKAIEVQIARHESQQQKYGYLDQLFNASKKREQLTKMEQRYQNYIENMKSMRIFKQRPSHGVEIIHRVARIFGESELMAPKDFVSEVKKYIELWKTTNRLPHAIERLKKSQLKPIVLNALEKQNLPPQFLYLSLQESGFKNHSIGPETRYGFAKGLWQFIPSTATEYGLKIGPLSTTNQYDSEDERFDFKKSTDAAARYLKDIYGNEAQASGLMVMASYNWGHNRVRKLIKQMPDNPRDRNFWQLIQKHKIPKETYDYVFYIFSAAVICEEPKYFGFNFENPLKD